jgi:hypothetical protein
MGGTKNWKPNRIFALEWDKNEYKNILQMAKSAHMIVGK